MLFTLLNIWKYGNSFGFELLGFDNDNEEEITYCLLGLGWNAEDRILGVDFLWKYFEFNFKKNIV